MTQRERKRRAGGFGPAVRKERADPWWTGVQMRLVNQGPGGGLKVWGLRLSLQLHVLSPLSGPLSPAQFCPPHSAHFGGSVYQILSLEAHRATAANSVPKEIQPLGPAVIGYMLSHVGSLTYPEPQTFLESQEAYGLLRIEFLNA